MSNDFIQTYYAPSSNSPESDLGHSQKTALPPHFFESRQAPFQTNETSPLVAPVAPVPMDDHIEMLELDVHTDHASTLMNDSAIRAKFYELVDQLKLNAYRASTLKPAKARAKIFKSLTKISSLHIPADCCCVKIYPASGFDHELEYQDGKLSVKIYCSLLDDKKDVGYSTYKRESADMIAHCLPDKYRIASLGDRRRGKLPVITDSASQNFVMRHHRSHRFWVAQALLYGLNAHGDADDIQNECVRVFGRNFETHRSSREQLKYTLNVNPEVSDIERVLKLYLGLYHHAYTHYTGKKRRRREAVIVVRWDGIPMDQTLAGKRPLGARPASSIQPRGKALNIKSHWKCWKGPSIRRHRPPGRNDLEPCLLCLSIFKYIFQLFTM